MKLSFLNILRIPLFVAALGMPGPGIQAANVNCNGSCCAHPSDVARVNHAYLTSPRGREEFPSLARTRPSNEARTPKVTRVEPNHALANTPRFREEHPELQRSTKRAAVKIADGVPGDVTKNSALAASPRAREEFPALRVARAGITARNSVCLCACVVQ